MEKQRTPLAQAIEKLQQKGSEAKTDDELKGLLFSIEIITELLQIEREAFEKAFLDGDNWGCDETPLDFKQYFNKTFTDNGND